MRGKEFLVERVLVDSQGIEVKVGDILWYSKLNLGAGKVGGKIKVEKIDGKMITVIFWHRNGGKETYVYPEHLLRGYITIMK